jgi:hypothetical protein
MIFSGKITFAVGVVVGGLVIAGPAYLLGDLLGGWEAAATARKAAELSAAIAETAVAQAQRDIAHKDLAIQQRTAERAMELAAEREELAQSAETRIKDYEAELARRVPEEGVRSDSCLLTPDDLNWLRAAPAGRRSAPAAGHPPAPGGIRDPGASAPARGPAQ